jgi:hypothetical protein
VVDAWKVRDVPAMMPHRPRETVRHDRDGTLPAAEMQRFITAFLDIHVEIEKSSESAISSARGSPFRRTIPART